VSIANKGPWVTDLAVDQLAVSIGATSLSASKVFALTLYPDLEP